MTRLSVNINAETEAALLARKTRGTTVTETVRRAVALYDLLDTATSNGERIRLVGNGPDRELMLLGTGATP